MPGHVLVEAAGVKSYSTFVKGAVSASALDHGETIRLVPDENRGVRKGFVPLSDLDMLLLSTCQDDELGAAVREVISRST
ncbi:MAG: hypothetical protein JXQ73_05295 [Phycisphaerae bacterium]|nr:hypothetical protein [Phycisphaerae bacterium]